MGEEAREFREEIVNNIKEHKLQGGVYVIILAVNGKDIFDIIPSVMLSEDGYKGRDIKILGIAKGLIEAKELADGGVTELLVVAQETTIYGTDLYGKKMLPEL